MPHLSPCFLALFAPCPSNPFVAPLSLLLPGVRHRTGLLQIELPLIGLFARIARIAPIAHRDPTPRADLIHAMPAQVIVRLVASQTRAPITKIVARAHLGRSEANSNRLSQATVPSCLPTVPLPCICHAPSA